MPASFCARDIGMASESGSPRDRSHGGCEARSAYRMLKILAPVGPVRLGRCE